ncbi:MAG: hypothetical protein CME64_03550 [Halobacteriovoraceae bacterium]|nr:hypothetical protein [Halobacteriovoraceae bacterium]
MKTVLFLAIALAGANLYAKESTFSNFLKALADNAEVEKCLNAKQESPTDAVIYQNADGNYEFEIRTMSKNGSEGPYFQGKQISNGEIQLSLIDGCK